MTDDGEDGNQLQRGQNLRRAAINVTVVSDCSLLQYVISKLRNLSISPFFRLWHTHKKSENK